MGFLNASFIAGAAERASEIMQEERENAQKVVDQSMKIWSELGIPAYKERKKKTNDLSMKFDTLSRMGYNTDQIELATRDGSLDKLIEYSKKAQSGAFGKDFNFVPAEVVRLGPDYKDSGRTKADYLESVMGKVERGMDLSDAIVDAGGKKVGFLGQNLSGIMKKRAEAFQTGLGVDIQYLGALARDDVTMTESPVTGTISMYDPTVEAQAEASLQGGRTGQPGISTTAKIVESNILAGLEGSVFQGSGGDGIPLYRHEIAEKNAELKRIIREEMAKKNINRYSAADLNELEEIVAKRMSVSVGQDGDKKADGITPSDATTMEDDAISRITKMPQDAGRQKSDIINDAVDKIYKYYLDKEGEAVAKAKAAEARDRMIKSITG